MQREALGIRHPSTLASISNLGGLLQVKGDLTAAEPLYREVLEVQRETLGNRHKHTLTTIHNLGALLAEKGKYEEAEPLCREVLEASRETLGNRHPDTLTSINNLGLLLKAKGDHANQQPSPHAEAPNQSPKGARAGALLLLSTGVTWCQTTLHTTPAPLGRILGESSRRPRRRGRQTRFLMAECRKRFAFP